MTDLKKLTDAQKSEIRRELEQNAERFRKTAEQIWLDAELGFEEKKSADLLCRMLREEGFSVETGIGGIETAFVGKFGEGKPVVAFLGEYDALPNLSQKAAVAVEEELAPGGNGHGCGHNLLGVASLAAAIAVKNRLVRDGISGSVRFYGCPAEENGAGKTIMARHGCFDDLDAAFTWHPMDYNMVECRRSLAIVSTKFRFSGRSAHAAASPHLGRSALDAVELLNVGANFLREHIIPEARLHYAITNPGGNAPNIVQAHAEVYYETRAPRFKDALDIRERLCDAARGAALMTGTSVEILDGDRYADFIPNHALNTLLYEKLLEVGPPAFTEADARFAADIQKTLLKEAVDKAIAEVTAVAPEIRRASIRDKVLFEDIIPYRGNHGLLPASTDVGDVSYLVPTVQLYTTCGAFGTPGHCWQKTAQSASGIGYAGMMTAAHVMALAAAELYKNTELLEEAKQELAETLQE